MLKWIRTHGCSCHPLAEGTEKYFINIGDVWGGIVQSHPATKEGSFVWESWYTVRGEKVSGMSGGGFGRDQSMEWIERRIVDAIAEVDAVRSSPVRRIFDSLCEKDPVTGEWRQQELN
jgi:hypothetical protein